jgi:NAD(P)-dependent dehydrogenase (short-subunit alcohol dehydrogenase family)
MHFHTGEIGNGRAAAILLARHGAKVALVDFNVEWAQDTKRMIDEEGGISEVIQADVTVEESCKNAVEKTVELFGSVHILVNIGKDICMMKKRLCFLTCDIVGVGGAIGDATTINLDAWERDFRINVTSMVMMSRYAIPEMRKQGRGSIINMSSVSGCKDTVSMPAHSIHMNSWLIMNNSTWW